MTTIAEIKEKVGRLVAEKGLSYSSISQSLGKNPSYLQKFVKEKSPQRLDEKFRRDLALLLNVDEQELTDLPLLPAHLAGVAAVAGKVASLFKGENDVVIDMLDATACCGDGIENLPEKVCGQWRLPIADFKSITSCTPKNVKMLRVKGDSMNPTIYDGDFVWVDISNNFVGSDGVYLIKTRTGISVKRLQFGLNSISVICDNHIYDKEVAQIGEIQIIGRVVHVLNSRKI